MIIALTVRNLEILHPIANARKNTMRINWSDARNVRQSANFVIRYLITVSFVRHTEWHLLNVTVIKGSTKILAVANVNGVIIFLNPHPNKKYSFFKRMPCSMYPVPEF